MLKFPDFPKDGSDFRECQEKVKAWFAREGAGMAGPINLQYLQLSCENNAKPENGAAEGLVETHHNFDEVLRYDVGGNEDTTGTNGSTIRENPDPASGKRNKRESFGKGNRINLIYEKILTVGCSPISEFYGCSEWLTDKFFKDIDVNCVSRTSYYFLSVLNESQEPEFFNSGD